MHYNFVVGYRSTASRSLNRPPTPALPKFDLFFHSLQPSLRLVPDLADSELLIALPTLVLAVFVYGTAFVCGAVVSFGVAFFEAEHFESCEWVPSIRIQ